jgi:hypothetical protein
MLYTFKIQIALKYKPDYSKYKHTATIYRHISIFNKHIAIIYRPISTFYKHISTIYINISAYYKHIATIYRYYD